MALFVWPSIHHPTPILNSLKLVTLKTIETMLVSRQFWQEERFLFDNIGAFKQKEISAH